MVKVAQFTVAWYNITFSHPTWFLANLHIVHIILNGIVDNCNLKFNMKILSDIISMLVLSPIIIPNTRNYKKKTFT